MVQYETILMTNVFTDHLYSFIITQEFFKRLLLGDVGRSGTNIMDITISDVSPGYTMLMFGVLFFGTTFALRKLLTVLIKLSFAFKVCVLVVRMLCMQMSQLPQGSHLRLYISWSVRQAINQIEEVRCCSVVFFTGTMSCESCQ